MREQPVPPPANRAERRGQKKNQTQPAPRQVPVHARSAQGRRVNPVRRTG